MDKQVVVDSTSDTITNEEVLLRLESSNGFISYAINFRQLGFELLQTWPEIAKVLPGPIKPLVEAFIFGLRHGPLQNLAKKHGVSADDYLKAKVQDSNGGSRGVDKDAAAIQLAVVLSCLATKRSQTRPDGTQEPIDITRDDLKVAYEGILRRVPSYDAPAHVEDEGVQPLLEAATESHNS